MNPSDPPALTRISSTEDVAASTPPPDVDLSDSQSPLAPYFLRASDVIAVTLLAAMFLLFSFLPLWHTDIWAHLKFGQWIVQHRELPAREPFSPFADSKPYIHFQWLTQSGLYLLFQLGERLAGGDELHRLAGGVDVLRSMFLALTMLRYVVLLLAYRRLTGSMPLACAGIFLDVLFLSRVQRPQVVSELFFACLLLALSRPVLSRPALVFVPLCLILWANMHGSYLVGLALLGIFFLGRGLEAGKGEETSPSSANGWSLAAVVRDTGVRRLLLAGVLSTAGIALLNPHGPRLYLYTLQMSKHPNIPTLDEWQPLDFRAGPGGHRGYLALLLLLLVSQAISPRGLSKTGLLLLVSFGVFPLLQQRMMAWWIVLVPWLLLPMWAALGERLSWPWLHYRSERTLAKLLLAGFLVFIALLWSPPVQWLRARGPHPLERSLSPGTPWKLAAQLKAGSDDKVKLLPELTAALQQGYPDGRFQGCIFASETQGDYLFWALPPDYPVFVYTHVHLFSKEHWQDCLTVKVAGAGWWEILDRYGVNLVVVEPEMNPRLANALKADSSWQIVLDETDLQSKRDPRTRVLIAVRKHPRPMVLP